MTTWLILTIGNLAITVAALGHLWGWWHFDTVTPVLEKAFLTGYIVMAFFNATSSGAQLAIKHEWP